jgi:DNA-directed RNA polymerase specialized sigma24 family protein
MTREEFEQLYEKARSRAVAAAARVSGDQEVAEDAVQEAAVYCLQRIDAQPDARVTESYFIQLATSRAKDRLKPRGRRHGTGTGPGAELALGSALDLDRALYGRDED